MGKGIARTWYKNVHIGINKHKEKQSVQESLSTVLKTKLLSKQRKRILKQGELQGRR